MYNTVINPLRKALMLSTNEYLILDAIYHLSNNIKYGGWAIISKQKLADEYDLSKRTIINIINALELKGLIIRDEKTKFLRASEIYCDAIQNKDKWIIASTSDERFISGNLQEVKNLHQGGEKIAPVLVKNLHHSGEKIAHNNNKDNNKDIYSNKIVTKFPSLNEVVLYFKENDFPEYLAKKFFDYYSVNDWKDSNGKKISSWKQKAQSVWFKEENKPAKPNPKTINLQGWL